MSAATPSPDRLLKLDATQRYTLGVVYEPDVVDAQGEYAQAPAIEKAAWDFLRKLQGQGLTKLAVQVIKSLAEGDARLDVTELVDLAKSLGDMHTDLTSPHGAIVESYLAPCDLFINGEAVRKGAWLLGVQWSPEYFAKIQAGERTGLSMGGTAIKVRAQTQVAA